VFHGENWDSRCARVWLPSNPCRNTLVPLLCLLPLVGPSVYLMLRPKTYGSNSSSS
jgi:hypothetical protein